MWTWRRRRARDRRDDSDHGTVIGSVCLLRHQPDDLPVVGNIEEQMIENQPVAKRRRERLAWRIGKSRCQLPPRGLARTEPRIEIAADDHRSALGNRAQQGIGLTAAGAIAEGAFESADPILEVCVDDDHVPTLYFD